jgi:hypothetical protein
VGCGCPDSGILFRPNPYVFLSGLVPVGMVRVEYISNSLVSSLPEVLLLGEKIKNGKMKAGSSCGHL